MSWVRARFKANPDDPRPVKWPPVGPYWVTGYSGENAIVVAYVKEVGEVYEQWPEAEDLDTTEEEEIEFTDRFAKPDWWKESP